MKKLLALLLIFVGFVSNQLFSSESNEVAQTISINNKLQDRVIQFTATTTHYKVLENKKVEPGSIVDVTLKTIPDFFNIDVFGTKQEIDIIKQKTKYYKLFLNADIISRLRSPAINSKNIIITIESPLKATVSIPGVSEKTNFDIQSKVFDDQSNILEGL